MVLRSICLRPMGIYDFGELFAEEATLGCRHAVHNLVDLEARCNLVGDHQWRSNWHFLPYPTTMLRQVHKANRIIIQGINDEY